MAGPATGWGAASIADWAAACDPSAAKAPPTAAVSGACGMAPSGDATGATSSSGARSGLESSSRRDELLIGAGGGTRAPRSCDPLSSERSAELSSSELSAAGTGGAGRDALTFGGGAGGRDGAPPAAGGTGEGITLRFALLSGLEDAAEPSPE